MVWYGFGPWSCGVISVVADTGYAVAERNEANNTDSYDRGPIGFNGAGCFD